MQIPPRRRGPTSPCGVIPMCFWNVIDGGFRWRCRRSPSIDQARPRFSLSCRWTTLTGLTGAARTGAGRSASPRSLSRTTPSAVSATARLEGRHRRTSPAYRRSRRSADRDRPAQGECPGPPCTIGTSVAEAQRRMNRARRRSGARRRRRADQGECDRQEPARCVDEHAGKSALHGRRDSPLRPGPSARPRPPTTIMAAGHRHVHRKAPARPQARAARPTSHRQDAAERDRDRQLRTPEATAPMARPPIGTEALNTVV